MLPLFPLLYHDKLLEDGMHQAKMKAMHAVQKSQAKQVHVQKEKQGTPRQMWPDVMFDEALALRLIPPHPQLDATGWFLLR